MERPKSFFVETGDCRDSGELGRYAYTAFINREKFPNPVVDSPKTCKLTIHSTPIEDSKAHVDG